MWTVLLSCNSQFVAAATKQLLLAANSCRWYPAVAAVSQQLLLTANSCCWQPTVAAGSQQLLLAANSCCWLATVATVSQHLLLAVSSCCGQPIVAAGTQQLLLTGNSCCQQPMVAVIRWLKQQWWWNVIIDFLQRREEALFQEVRNLMLELMDWRRQILAKALPVVGIIVHAQGVDWQSHRPVATFGHITALFNVSGHHSHYISII